MVQMRELNIDDASSYLKMLNQLDSETKMMMYEAGERSQEIEKIVHRLKDTNIWTYGIVENDTIIGFISMSRAIPKRVRHCGYIVIGILKCAQNKGYGQALFKQAIDYAKENHILRLELTVMKTNENAIHLYKKVGFQIEGERKKSLYVDGAYVDEWLMSYLMEE